MLNSGIAIHAKCSILGHTKRGVVAKNPSNNRVIHDRKDFINILEKVSRLESGFFIFLRLKIKEN
jgi:hypothetical protein